MNRTEIKSLAKSKMSANMWPMIVAYILYSFLVGVVTSTFVGIILTGVLAFGWATMLLSIMRGKEFDIKYLISAIDKDFVRTCIVGLLHTIYIALWTLLFFIPGIVKSYSYAMTYFIMNDDETIGANDAITKSREMMNGHKWELFMLDLSFFGWILLSILTFGILSFWVTPYMNLAHAEFYRRLKGESDVVTEVLNADIAPTSEW